MHFMNPVPVMGLVEIIRGIATSDATAQTVEALAKRFGKTPISCNDYPGFVSNRVLMPMINEAIETLREGVAAREAIDGIMKLGMNHPMGPLELADFIGLDTCLAILRVLHEGFGDPKYRPSPLLVRMVDAGWLGRKSGKGFYEYGGKASA
jgi:3-hydroxybutyryl-CoA dehydrogenase